MSRAGDRSRLTVRGAREHDIEGIRAIESRPDYREFIGCWSEQEYREALADGSREVVVAVDASTVIGYYVLLDLNGKDRCVNLMRIAAANPGRGVGRALLEDALARAFVNHAAHRLWLDVFTTNQRAQQIYRSFGFVDEGVLRESKLRDGRYQSQLIMSLLESEYRDRKGI